MSSGPSRLALTVAPLPSHAFAWKNWRYLWRQVPSNLLVPTLDPLVPSQGERCSRGESTEPTPMHAVQVPALLQGVTAAKPGSFLGSPFLHLSREGGAGWS